MTAPAPRPARTRERAFALPLVILLSLVAVVIVTAMLGRQSTQALAVARQTEAVRDWHFSRGVQEIVNAWVRSHATFSTRDLLGADGKAFDLVTDDGTTLSLYMVDAQDTLLTDTTGLTGDEVLDLRAALDNLAHNVSQAELLRLTRKVGPPQVSLWSASPEVLAAVCRQAVGFQAGDACQRALLELRETKQKVFVSDLNDALGALAVNDKAKMAVVRMIAVEPTLFRFALDVRPPQSSTVTVRYTGYLVVRSALGSGNPRTTAASAPRTAFLSWQKLEPR